MYRKILCLMLLLANFPAMAATQHNKFYAGSDVSINTYTVYSSPGLSIYGGYNWDNFGLELGYSFLAKEQWRGDINCDIESRNMYVDGFISLPITQALNVRGLMGAGLFHSDISNVPPTGTWISFEGSATSLGFRIGAGLEYQLNQNWAIDLTYRLQTNCMVLIGHMNIYSLGIKYYFV